MRYEVYFSNHYGRNGKGKLIGKAETQDAAIEMGANYPKAGFFGVYDTKTRKWIEI